MYSEQKGAILNTNRMNAQRLATLSLVAAVAIILIAGALSLPQADAAGMLENPLGQNATIPDVLKRIFNQITIFLGFVVPIIIIIGAFQMMFAAGNPEKFAEGKKTIAYAIIGYVIVLMANGIVAIVQRILTSN